MNFTTEYQQFPFTEIIFRLGAATLIGCALG